MIKQATIQRLKKLASTLSDQKLDQIIDAGIDYAANTYQGFGSSIVNPIKKQLIKFKLDRDNARSGLRNLYSSAKDQMIDVMSDELASGYNTAFKKENPEILDRLKFISDAAKAKIGIGDNSPENNTFTRFNEAFESNAPKIYIKELLAKAKQFNSFPTKDFFKRLNSGYFNSKRLSDKFVDSMIKKYELNNVLSSHMKEEGKDLIGLIAKFSIKNKLKKALANAEDAALRYSKFPEIASNNL